MGISISRVLREAKQAADYLANSGLRIRQSKAYDCVISQENFIESCGMTYVVGHGAQLCHELNYICYQIEKRRRI